VLLKVDRCLDQRRLAASWGDQGDPDRQPAREPSVSNSCVCTWPTSTIPHSRRRAQATLSIIGRPVEARRAAVSLIDPVQARLQELCRRQLTHAQACRGLQDTQVGGVAHGGRSSQVDGAVHALCRIGQTSTYHGMSVWSPYGCCR
jgi:hypothetical protein